MRRRTLVLSAPGARGRLPVEGRSAAVTGISVDMRALRPDCRVRRDGREDAPRALLSTDNRRAWSRRAGSDGHRTG